MLATMERPKDAVYTNPVEIRQTSEDPSTDPLALENRLCPGCKLSAATENGGLVVAFGQSYFHVNCFRCAKCGEQVNADTNLLLLSDGSPICANCSYNCNICQLPILDEAIMTGDDSYHAHCFKCKVCKNRIDELVFAKTSQGIYCMDCHNERMAKIRKHNEKKAEREREKAALAAAGGSSSSRHRYRENGTGSTRENGSKPPSRHAARPDGAYVMDAFDPGASPSYSKPIFSNAPSSLHPSAVSAPVSESAGHPSPPVFHPPPRESSISPHAEQLRSTPMKQNTLPNIPTQITEPPTQQRRKSQDEQSPRLSNQFPEVLPPPTITIPASSDASTAMRPNRRSINPGLTLKNSASFTGPSALSSSPTLSPLSAQFVPRPSARSPSPTYGGRESPRSPGFTPPSDPSVRPTNGPLHSPNAQFSPHASRQSSASEYEKGSRPRSDASQDSTVVVQPPLRSGRSFDERPNSRASGSSRPASRQEVPHSIESGTDSEVDDEGTGSSSSCPPALPPKNEKATALLSPVDATTPTSDIDGDSPNVSQSDTVSDESESSPVEATSHATFIAPALPPIRFSMNTADFADLFNSVGGLPALKSIHQSLSEVQRSAEGVPLTPPPSARSLVTSGDDSETPTSDVTVIDPALSQSSSSEGMAGPLPREASKSSEVQLSGTRKRASSEAQPETLQVLNASINNPSVSPRVTISTPGSSAAKLLRAEAPDTVLLRLQEALADAKERSAHQLKLDRAFVEAIIKAMESHRNDLEDLKSKFDGVKRASKQYIDGLTVAQTEYDRELKGRRDAEAEVTRLRVLLSGQTARLTALSGDSRRQELRQQMSKELHENLSGLEHDLSKLKVQRDMTLAEVEELSATKSLPAVPDPPANMGRSLSIRLDKLKSQYQRELVPLREQREALSREIMELKAARDVFLEETTVLNARNEELAQLSAQYARRIDTIHRLESLPETPAKSARAPEPPVARHSEDKARTQPPQLSQQSQSSIQTHLNSSSVSVDDTADLRYVKVPRTEIELPTPSKAKFIKWPGSKTKDVLILSSPEKGKALQEHNFQQLSILRFTRCDHCGDKMWGSQLRCTACNISVHVRCINHVQVACSSQQTNIREDATPVPLPPSMFGRDLVEQVNADAKGSGRLVPVIVEKCIDAVEAIAMDYEGIYRKTGGSSQSKTITQLFERGDYDAFDLKDSDRFNDICSVTSVLKTYFRSLPVPLLTYDLHDHFMSAVEIRESVLKSKTLTELVKKLPPEHFYTLRLLMLHLHRIFQRSEKNLMNARNLGVVFGPTLMRSRNPGAEFSDMAGKALSIEWLVENALQVFGHSLN